MRRRGRGGVGEVATRSGSFLNLLFKRSRKPLGSGGAGYSEVDSDSFLDDDELQFRRTLELSGARGIGGGEDDADNNGEDELFEDNVGRNDGDWLDGSGNNEEERQSLTSGSRLGDRRSNNNKNNSSSRSNNNNNNNNNNSGSSDDVDVDGVDDDLSFNIKDLDRL